jgi:hypothetical protein
MPAGLGGLDQLEDHGQPCGRVRRGSCGGVRRLFQRLQQLNFWTRMAFSFWPTVNTPEPLSAWRSRWVLMEQTQYEFYRLRDELIYYVASTSPERLSEEKIT